MGKKKSKEESSNQEPSDAIKSLFSAIKSLFSADNPFRRKPQAPIPDTPAPPPEFGLGLDDGEDPRDASISDDGAVDAARKRKRDKGRTPNRSPTSASDSIRKKRKKELEDEEEEAGESPRKRRKKRKREEVEEEYEQRKYGAVEKVEGGEEGAVVVAVGRKRKADDDSKEMAVTKDSESFDDESKLLRTVFVGNLPLKTKRKALLKEFGIFGEIESVRIRSVPIVDSKIPRKGAVIRGKINEAIDSVHAYIVFHDEQSARAALSHNMAQVGGNHIRVDMACPPRKKLKGEPPLYDRKRTVFVGNLPFDVKDEELYHLFCGLNQAESIVEAVRVVRDPNTSVGKGIAYVLFKTREAANTVVKRRDLKIRDRALRVCHAKSDAATLSKRKDPGNSKDSPGKKFARKSNYESWGKNDKPKVGAASLTYQGLRSSKSGVVKKSGLRPRPAGNGNHGTKKAGGADQKAHKTKRPAVAARKAKILMKKRKQEAGTPENTHQNKKVRRQ